MSENKLKITEEVFVPEAAVYLLPVTLSDCAPQIVLPQYNLELFRNIKFFVVENIRTARRFLKKVDHNINIDTLKIVELNEHTLESEIPDMLTPVLEGHAVGVMSEAGCPAVADPGARLVELAQRKGVKVIPLVGPSSILLALMASGLNGQKFAFQGYLPVKDHEREKMIRDLESESRRKDITQIFIETPYRNSKMMESLLKNLSGETLLCVAADVTDPTGEKIVTKSVKHWKSGGFELDKVPTIFLFYCLNPGNRK